MKINLPWVVVILAMSLLVACSGNRQQGIAEQHAAETKKQQAAALNTQLALNYISQNNLVLAKEKLLAVLKQMPNYGPANSAMAYYLECTGDLKNAEDYYLKAIRIADIKGSPENNYGAFLCRQERYQQADSYFQLAIKDQRYVNTAKAYENAGLCAQLVPDPEKAIAYFRKALQHDPNLKNSMLQLAKLDYAAGNYVEGHETIKNYLSVVASPAAENLWLAIRLAHLTGNEKVMTQYATTLQEKFFDSPEYQQYLQLQASL